MDQHRRLTGQVAREVPRPRRGLRALTLGAALAAVLAGGTTEQGARAVFHTRAFLEFYVGVFALVGLSASVVAGLTASSRFTPVRLRVLAQSAHRAVSVMTVSFLGAHILLEVLGRRASIADAVVPLGVWEGHAPWLGLGAIASDTMIFIFVTGVARGRFAGGVRPWAWRVLHAAAYLCWPIAILHGLNAGRTARDWVTLSYAACLGVVAVMALTRLVFASRRRRAVRRPGGREAGRTARRMPDAETQGVPDERFWAELKREAGLWTGSGR
ncbi:hypothetical protein GCM10017673_45550 [Streptosporangium violaceochromogenes]|nr:hypothetical protein GCM10017673_45550 [Streptosporangium violaceochromogenes]